MAKRTGRHRRMRQHAKERAIERFGIELQGSTRDRMIRDIQSGRAVPVNKISKRVTVFLLEFAGQPCKVLYDCHRKEIATVMDVRKAWKHLPQHIKYRYDNYLLRRKLAAGLEDFEPCVTG